MRYYNIYYTTINNDDIGIYPGNKQGFPGNPRTQWRFISGSWPCMVPLDVPFGDNSPVTLLVRSLYCSQIPKCLGVCIIYLYIYTYLYTVPLRSICKGKGKGERKKEKKKGKGERRKEKRRTKKGKGKGERGNVERRRTVCSALKRVGYRWREMQKRDFLGIPPFQLTCSHFWGLRHLFLHFWVWVCRYPHGNAPSIPVVFWWIFCKSCNFSNLLFDLQPFLGIAAMY